MAFTAWFLIDELQGSRADPDGGSRERPLASSL